MPTRTSKLNICSIGCGPCSELIAFEELRIRDNLSFPYSFTGFDNNARWTAVQDFIKTLLNPNNHISFSQQDVFEYYQEKDVFPAMIILNYMLSDFLKSNFDLFDDFLENMYAFIRRIPSCAILINDINIGLSQNNVRYYFDRIATRIQQENDGIVVRRFHFNDSLKNCFHYGEDIASNQLLFTVSENINNTYSPNSECHSVQLLIIKSRIEI